MLPSPPVLSAPSWERSVLGPTVQRAWRRLQRQLRTGEAWSPVYEVLERAYRSVPFYQRLFADARLGLRDLRTARGLACIPITRRSDLSCGVEHFLSTPTPPWVLERGWHGKTSGSTGIPVSYLRDPRTIAWFYAFVRFALRYAKAPAYQRNTQRAGIVLLDGLGLRNDYEAKLPLFFDAPFAKVSVHIGPQALRQRLQQLAPWVLTGDPAALAIASECDLPQEKRPFLILSSAFAMPAHTRAALQNAFGAPVLEYYSTQETSIIAVQCLAGRGFHALSDACHIEAVPNALAPDQPSELVVTPTHTPTFTLVRYSPGDLGTVAFDRSPCPCGLRGTRIVTLAGRTNVFFENASGGVFSAGKLVPLLSRLPVHEFQLEELGEKRFALRVRGTSSEDALGAPLRQIVQRLEQLVESKIHLEIHWVEQLPLGPGQKPLPLINRFRCPLAE